jgi:hypothetical protein
MQLNVPLVRSLPSQKAALPPCDDLVHQAIMQRITLRHRYACRSEGEVQKYLAAFDKSGAAPNPKNVEFLKKRCVAAVMTVR